MPVVRLSIVTRGVGYYARDLMKIFCLHSFHVALSLCLALLLVTGCGGASSVQPVTSTPSASPMLQSVTPNVIAAGSTATTLTIVGTGFTTASVVTVANTPVPTVYVSVTQLTATVPAGQLASGTQLQVAVMNGAGGTPSAPVTLSVDNPLPTLASLSPSAVGEGATSASVSLTGTGFVPGSVVAVPGGARPTTYTSATMLTVSLTAADLANPGSLGISVANPAPGGGSSAALQLSIVNPSPAITSVSPASAAAGSSAILLDITGTGFLPGSTVTFGGTALTVSVVSSTEVHATVPAALLATGTTASLALSNPAPGGGISAPVAFSVIAPAPTLTTILPRNVQTGSAGATITLAGSGFLANSVAQWNGAGTYGSACLYNAGSNSYSPVSALSSYPNGIALSPDGNLVGSGRYLNSATGVAVGDLAYPTAFYSVFQIGFIENQMPTAGLVNPRLNDAGSLYFWAYPRYFEIFDVPTGRLRLRFSLAETIQSTLAPMALDGGHRVFLITDKGLTVVDMGSSLLSIGHLNASTASPGMQIGLRGSGFATGIIATLGGSAAELTFTDENTATLTVPALTSGPKDLVLTNPDGATYVLQSAVIVP